MEPTSDLKKIKKEISKIVVGQEEVIDGLLRAILADGHVLVEGVPGIAKTLLVRTMAVVTGCSFKRIQFTVDLLPTDITGITAYHEKKGFYIVKGPIFANYIIADEINRAPPKTQSALLEAMQEKQATIGKETYPIPIPFFVMANNNPIEQAGVYPLPEAQIDRFLFKLKMGYPDEKQSKEIIEKNITLKRFDDYKLKAVTNPKEILKMQAYTRSIKHSDKIKDYICKIVIATRNPKKYGINLGKYIEWGASPRANIGLFIAAKADAVMKGNKYITPSNIKNIAYDVLRHRILLNYRGRAEGINTDDVIKEVLAKVPLP
ncbi:MAG: MoxR family ATPase [archaeon]